MGELSADQIFQASHANRCAEIQKDYSDQTAKKIDDEEALVLAQKMISGVWRCESRFGAGHVIDVLLGKRTEKVLANKHQNLSVFGLMSEYRDQLLRAINRAAGETKQRVQVIEQGHQGPDHPVLPAMSETEYLHAFFLRCLRG